MAKARALDKRRKSVRNIRKITRTMELVATAQFRRAMERAIAADAYTKRLVGLVGDLARAGGSVSHPLLEPRSECKTAAVLVLSANRGMCGGYNSSILRMAQRRYVELQAEVPALQLMVSGNRGATYMKYRGVVMDKFFNQFDHKPTFEDVDEIAERLLDDYMTGKLDRLEVAYTKFVSLSKQYPVVETLLPLTELASVADVEGATDLSAAAGAGASSAKKKHAAEYEFLPSATSILEEVVPMTFKLKLFKCFLDAAVSEQIARRVAMKAATENADSMIRILTTTYNRARQSQITNEIIEVVSGASAME